MFLSMSFVTVKKLNEKQDHSRTRTTIRPSTDIPPRTNNNTFTINVYGVPHYRYTSQFTCAYLQCKYLEYISSQALDVWVACHANQLQGLPNESSNTVKINKLTKWKKTSLNCASLPWMECLKRMCQPDHMVSVSVKLFCRNIRKWYRNKL